jgi:hypothetical protein
MQHYATSSDDDTLGSHVKIRSLLNSTKVYKEHQGLSPGDNGSIEERIRQRAYELYEERGRHDGYHAEDWAQAEEQIRDQHDFDQAA